MPDGFLKPDDPNGARKNDALLHFYFKSDPDQWDDDKYADKLAQLRWVLNYTQELEFE